MVETLLRIHVKKGQLQVEARSHRAISKSTLRAKGGVYGHSELKAAQEAAQNAQTPTKEETTEAISCPS